MTVKRKWLMAGGLFLLVLIGLLGWVVGGQGTPFGLYFGRDSTWHAMEKRSVWRVGVDPSFPPFEWLDETTGKPIGFDVALAGRLAETWDMQVEIVPIGFDSLLDALRANKIDSVLSAYPYDPRLTRDFAFSQPYFDAGLQLAVRPGSPIHAPADLGGKRVAVEWGSAGDMVGRRLQREGIDVALAPFETPDLALNALFVDNSIDALLVDNVTLRQAQASGRPVVAIGEPLESVPYVVVMPTRARELQQRVHDGLVHLTESGALRTLEETWFARRD
ncbi:MAG: amino acid ABC transporter substrate-binding protein [Anaerolineales bacterium]|nr:amino acid ABC transporter substrate-binding protein [Anaerolineales bacterium]